MKSLRITFLFIAFMAIANLVFAQTKTEKIKVSGECGTCKKKIETAAKKAGASYAAWDVDSKILTVKYNSTSSNTAKIEKSVAAAGYDTPDVKATDEAYQKLDGCCQYERTASSGQQSCCNSEKCTSANCMKDGKCAKDMSCCKESGCDQKACCKKS